MTGDRVGAGSGRAGGSPAVCAGRHNRRRSGTPSRARYSQAFVLNLIIAAGIASPSLATTFSGNLSIDTLLAHSVTVVRGTVADIRTTESLRTLVKIDPATALVGWQLPGPLVLTEDGGRYGAKLRWVAGAPEYRIGEEVIVFVAQRADGTLHTADLGMGKYEIEAGRAMRRLGGGTNVLRAGRLLPPRDVAIDAKKFGDSIRARRGQLRPANRAFRVPSDARAEAAEAFTYLGTPARWFDPVVTYGIDRNGPSGFNFTSARYAAQQAAAAWSGGASLSLAIGDAIDPVPLAGCDGSSGITFDDPAGEVDDLANCAGTLAVSGFCSSSETTVVGAQVYRRIVVGKVLVNDGVGECLRGDPCKLAEILTHELGHTIGLGHSADSTATMSAVAHFDGRCASVRQDDLATEAVAYPAPAVRTPMVTATATPNQTTTPGVAAVAGPPVRNAVAVAQSVPLTLAPGQVTTVQMTVRNAGTTTWTRAEGYKLGFNAPRDETTWGMSRVLLAPADAIGPGQETTFVWSVTAPATVGTYPFGWRMVQDGITWFGDATPEIKVEVKAP